jgi:hypothetical protein
MKLLFLDDVREPKQCIDYMQLPIYAHSQWQIVKSYDKFVKWIQDNGIPQIVSFDYDLASEHYTKLVQSGSSKRSARKSLTELTGYDCALYLVEECRKQNKPLPRCLIHSMNPVGKKRILDVLHYAQTSLL